MIIVMATPAPAIVVGSGTTAAVFWGLSCSV
jgi:hypothetical protein